MYLEFLIDFALYLPMYMINLIKKGHIFIEVCARITKKPREI